jgi:hypothetical protein
MRLDKLFNGIKNIDHIIEGIKNKTFKKQWIEDIANDRWMICKGCEHLDTIGGKCAAPGTQPCCADCGCSLGFKTRALSASCPKGKWQAHVNANEEAAIIRELNNNK